MSWQQLLDIVKEGQAEADYWDSQPPQACPNDGEPLLPGPPDSEAVLYCRYDGWQYPRDWVRPSEQATTS